MFGTFKNLRVSQIRCPKSAFLDGRGLAAFGKTGLHGCVQLVRKLGNRRGIIAAVGQVRQLLGVGVVVVEFAALRPSSHSV